MEEGDFRPPTAPRPLDRFSWNLKYITNSRTRPHMQNFRGYVDVVVWANSQFDAETDARKFLSFFPLFSHAHRSHLWTHPNAQYVIMRRSHQGSAFCGLERWNLKFDPFTLPLQKNVKIGTFSWRSMEIAIVITRSRTVYTSQTWHRRWPLKWHHVSRYQTSRSQGHVTYSVKNCNNLVVGGPINFIVGGWHGNDGCLATAPRNLHFMAAYFKNKKAYKLRNGHI